MAQQTTEQNKKKNRILIKIFSQFIRKHLNAEIYTQRLYAHIIYLFVSCNINRILDYVKA